MKLSEAVREKSLMPQNETIFSAYLKNLADSIEVLEVSAAYQLEDMEALRDQFAMAALQGIISRIGSDPQYAAKSAYTYADEMMEARK